jgi:DNA polymerase III epsilon subunit-like protein
MPDSIIDLFSTSIDRTTKQVDDFVSGVDAAYKARPNQVVLSDIAENRLTGDYTINGAYEPLVSQQDLSRKLDSLVPSSKLNLNSIRDDTYSFVRTLYSDRAIGLEAPQTQTLAGDLARPDSTFIDSRFLMGTMYDRAANVTTILSGSSSRTFVEPTFLEVGMQQLQQQLATNYNIDILVTKTQDGSIGVTVPDIDILGTGEILTQSGKRDLLRSKSKSFQFAATAGGGVLDVPSYRYIGASYLGKTEQTAVDTTVGIVRTYVLQQQIILQQARSLAFRQFLQDRQSYSSPQQYLELDKFLGNLVGSKDTFSQHVNTFATNNTEVTKFKQELRARFIQLAGTQNYSQLSTDRLTQIYTQGIDNILKPLGQTGNLRQDVGARVVGNLARLLLDPQTVTDLDGKTIRVDAFANLKQEILRFSWQGNLLLQSRYDAMLRQQIQGGRKNLIEQLMSPYLQPHESNFSGAQQLARRAYYLPDRSPLSLADGSNQLLQLGGTYKHGSGNIALGKVYAGIAAQTSSLNIYDRRHHDSQLESMAAETTTFYDINTLFSGSKQLSITSLAILGTDLNNYANKDEWLERLKADLYLQDNAQPILLVPYRKSEQIPQRLKNLTGTKPAIQYSSEFYRDILQQADISKYYNAVDGVSTNLNRAKAISANVDSVLAPLQFERLKAAMNAGEDATEFARINDANPQAELRGLATNAAPKRMLIGTGLHQLSDYMHVNAAHESYYGYEQYTKVQIESVSSYDSVGGKLYATNIASDRQRTLLQTVFAPGRFIYYKEQQLYDRQTLDKIEAYRTLQLESYAADNGISATEAWENTEVRKAINLKIKRKFEFVQGISVSASGQLDVKLKAGLYGFNDRGTFERYGSFDGDSSRLYIGLAPRADRNGNLTKASQLTVKISGRLRGVQEGVAVTNDLLNFNEVDGKLIGHASYTILFNGAVRPGVENVKGPARFDDAGIFDYYDRSLSSLGLGARSLQNNPIYAVAASASFKGFNYEAGLEVLTSDAAKADFFQRLRSDRSSTALFANYFVGDLSKNSTDAKEIASLKAQNERLVAAIERRFKEQNLKLKVGINSNLTKNAGLFINNAGLFDLIDSQVINYKSLGTLAPLAQIQQTLIVALESGDNRFIDKAINLFEAASKEALKIKDNNVFNQGSAKVRAAAVASSLFGLSLQVIDSQKQRIAETPLIGSKLELNLIDSKTGTINEEIVFGSKYSQATMDLLFKAKAEFRKTNNSRVRETEITKLREKYRAGELTERDRNSEVYRSIAARVADVYAASEVALPFQVAIRVAPSKIQQAAGSKDTANLEYHYSSVMSKQQIDRMRGYVSDPNELTEVAAAYRMLVRFAKTGTLEDSRFILPFASSESIADYKLATGGLKDTLQIHSILELHGSNTYFDRYARAAISGDAEAVDRLSVANKLLTETVSFYAGTEDLNLRERALALASLFDARRFGDTKVKTSRSNRLTDKFIFFDIETTGLMDKRFPKSDPRHFPTGSISEVAFVFFDGTNSKEITWHHQNKGEFATLESALTEVTRLMQTTYQDAALVGHNVREFDIPTLAPKFRALGLDLGLVSVIDTLNDVDRKALKQELSTNKHSLSNIYSQIEKSRLIKLAALGDEAAAQALNSRNYANFEAHVALEDVKANIKVFEFLQAKNLLRTATGSNFTTTGDLLLDGARVTYFDAGSESEFYNNVKALATQISKDANGINLNWFLDRHHHKYKDLAVEVAGREGATIYEHALRLLKLSSHQSGFLKSKQVSALFDRYALESDRAVERKIESALGYNESTYIENLRQQALSFKKAELSFKLSGDGRSATRAREMHDFLHQSRTLLLPELQLTANTDGSYKANFIESKVKGQPLLSQSILYIGNDILTQLPKEFETFVPRLVRHRQDLDSLLPAYFETIAKVQKGDNLSVNDFELIKQVQVLSIVNKDIVYEALGGALAQRAFGEKTKTSGVSSTAVGSYLLGSDEITMGSRFTSTLAQDALKRIAAITKKGYGKDSVLVLRAGGPSGASQLDQSYTTLSVTEFNQRATDMGTAVKLDPKKNSTTVIMPVYGRFSSQGGDFDGDSYAIISRYQDELVTYAQLLEQRQEREFVRRQLQKRLELHEEYFVNKYSRRLAKIDFNNRVSKAAALNNIRADVSKNLAELQNNKYVDTDKMLHNLFVLDNPDFVKVPMVVSESPLVKAFGKLNSLVSDRTTNGSAFESLSYFLNLQGKDLLSTYDLLQVRVGNSKEFRQAAQESSPFARAIEFLNEFERKPRNSKSVALPKILLHTLVGKLDIGSEIGGIFVNELISKFDKIEPQHFTTITIGKRLREAEVKFLTAAMKRGTTEWHQILERNLELTNKKVNSFILERLKRTEAKARAEAFLTAGRLETTELPTITEEGMQDLITTKQAAAQEKFKELELKSELPRSDEIEFIKSQLGEIEDYNRLTSKQLADKEKSISKLLKQTDDIGKVAEAAMRRHVAAYTGIPLAFFDERTQLFSSARIYNAIEQHRGVMPGLEDLDASITNAGDFNLNLIEKVAEFHRQVIAPLAQIKVYSPEFLEAKFTQAAQQLETYDPKIANALKSAIEHTGIADTLDYTHQQLLDKTLAIANEETALSAAMAGIAKFVSNAGGGALSDKAFTALSMTIGAAGTNLIGEAYNAITILSSKAFIARSLSEVYTNNRQSSTHAEADSNKFTSVMLNSLEAAFPTGGEWGTSKADKERASQAKELLIQTFANPERLGASSFDRAQALTGMLANVQQSIRDSLKQKLDKGMLDSIMEKQTHGNMTAYDLLTSEYTSDEERLPALRKFLGQDAGESIFQLPGEGSNENRYKVTAFGALFLLNDYLTINSTNDAEKLIGLNGKGDDSYEFLKIRYMRLQRIANQTGDARLAAMLEPDAFIAHSVVDLLAMSTAERATGVMKFAGEDFEQFRNLTKEAFINDGSLGSPQGFTKEALQAVRQQYFLDDGLNGRSQAVAESLYFDPHTGQDLLTTPEARISAAASLGLKTDGSDASFNSIKDKFWQLATTNFIYHNLKATGITPEDLLGMRETAKATKHLRFDSIEGATTFRDFVNQSSNAIESLLIESSRDRMDDPRQRATMSYEAGSKLFAAMHDVKQQIENQYGKGILDKDGGVPIETLRAYRHAEQIAGIFNNMLGNEDASVRTKASEMFSIAMSRGQDGTSGWQELSHFLGGVAQMRKNEDLLMFALDSGEQPAVEVIEFNQKYLEAKENANLPEFLVSVGEEAGKIRQETVTQVVAERSTFINNEIKTANKTQRHSVASAFLVPGLTLLFASSQTDSNLTEHAYGAVQAAAQVAEMGNHHKYNTAALFQVDRLRQSIASEGKVFGTLRGAASEVLFESISRLSHRAVGTDIRAGRKSYLAEVATTLLATIASSLTTDRKFGARQEDEENYQAEALLSIPSLALGTADAAIEDFLNSTSMPIDAETEIEYSATLKIGEETLASQFAAGWLKANPFRDLAVEVIEEEPT